MWDQAFLDGKHCYGSTATRRLSQLDHAPPIELTVAHQAELKGQILKVVSVALRSSKAASLRIKSLNYLPGLAYDNANTASLLELCRMLPRLETLEAGRLLATVPRNFEFQRYTDAVPVFKVMNIVLGWNPLISPPSLFELFQFLRCFPQLQHFEICILDIQHEPTTSENNVPVRLVQEHIQVVSRPIDLSHLRLKTFHAYRVLPGFEMLLSGSRTTLSELSVGFQENEIRWLSSFVKMLSQSTWTALKTLQLWWQERRQQPSPVLIQLIQTLPRLRELKYSGPAFNLDPSTMQTVSLDRIVASVQAPLHLLSIRAEDLPLLSSRADHLITGIVRLIRSDPSCSQLQVLQIEAWCRDGKSLRDAANTASRVDLVETCRERRICLEW